MARWLHRPWKAGRSRWLAMLLWAVTLSPAAAQFPDQTDVQFQSAANRSPDDRTAQKIRARDMPPPAIEERLRQLEQRQAELVAQNRRLAGRLIELDHDGQSPTAASDPDVNLIAEYHDSISAHPSASAEDDVPIFSGTFDYAAGYEDGFFIAPTDPARFPFSLKVNSQTQLRYTGFARAVRTFTDNAGVTSPVTDRSNFELPRGRAIFSGFAFLPDLTYNLKIDYNTVTTNQVNFLAYWLAYRFNRSLTLYLGQNNVPGSREWLVSSMGILGPDRSMATTFFRPSLSQGIWATGEPVDGVFYHAMIANGFNTLGTTPSQLDSRMAFSLSVWAEPWGDFGPAYSDFEWHDEPAIRCGTSLTFAPEKGQQGSPDVPENADIRLTDGTLLTAPGALAPGVTLNVYDVGLAAFDLAYKYRGLSVSGELYLRELFNLQGNGPLPRTSIFDYGGFVQVGYFVLPKKFEVYGRTSQITGPFGTGSEYAGGFNWFFLPDKQNLRYTLDAAWINHSPADQNRTDYRAGDTGVLIRSQIQFFF